MRATDLRGANLFSAHLEHASLNGAHLEGAGLNPLFGLKKEQLASAILDKETELPDDLGYDLAAHLERQQRKRPFRPIVMIADGIADVIYKVSP